LTDNGSMYAILPSPFDEGIICSRAVDNPKPDIFATPPWIRIFVED